MAFIVVYDASVLYGNTLRDLLIRIAQTGLVQAKWTHRIIDEALAAVAKNHEDLTAEQIARLKKLMIAAIPRTVTCLQRPSRPVLRSSSHRIRTSRRMPWHLGTSRRSRQMISCSTR